MAELSIPAASKIMAETPNYTNTSQTLAINLNEFKFDTVEHLNGLAVVVRFYVDNPAVKAGDVVVVLDDASDIHFHGMIESLDETGLATASDRRDSRLVASVG